MKQLKTTLPVLIGMIVAHISLAQKNPIQTTIESALGQSFATQTDRLSDVIDELKKDEEKNAYWIAFAQFRSGIFHMQTKNTESAAKLTKAAIETLEGIKEKSSEDHALLGHVLSFSISFEPQKAASISGRASRSYRLSLDLDEANLRAYLGLGTSDYYTPAQYGGGKKVEEYLTKAISLKDQSVASGPDWGKNEAYYILASFYQREGNIDKAKMYCVQGLGKFPNDYQLNTLKNSL